MRVIEPVDNLSDTGRALYNGVEWTARSQYDTVTFEKDEQALVAGIVGVKLILQKMPNPAHAEDTGRRTQTD